MAPGATAESHLRLMADVLDEARHSAPGPALPVSLLPGLMRLVECDYASFSELDLPTRRSLAEQDTAYDDGWGQVPLEEHMEGYWQWRHQHRQCLRVSQTHSTPEVTQLADFMSDRELLRLPIYSDFLRPFRSILAVALPTAPDRTRVFQLFREDAKPFSDQEITTLRLLAPHLYAIYREASARRRTPVRLTVRELDVMRCVAQGLGTRQIAEQLVVSPSTVRKHLENIFHRLGVSSRLAAVARVFPEPDGLYGL